MKQQRVSIRYARAILNNAQTTAIEDTVWQDLNTIDRMINSSNELKAFIESPIIKFSKKEAVMKELLEGKINNLTLQFVYLLVKKRRESILPSIIEQFNILYDILKNRIQVDIVSAVELSEDIKTNIIAKISDLTKKQVVPAYKVKPEIKGGIEIKINDWVFDATLKNTLEKMYQKLAFAN